MGHSVSGVGGGGGRHCGMRARQRRGHGREIVGSCRLDLCVLTCRPAARPCPGHVPEPRRLRRRLQRQSKQAVPNHGGCAVVSAAPARGDGSQPPQVCPGARPGQEQGRESPPRWRAAGVHSMCAGGAFSAQPWLRRHPGVCRWPAWRWRVLERRADACGQLPPQLALAIAAVASCGSMLPTSPFTLF